MLTNAIYRMYELNTVAKYGRSSLLSLAPFSSSSYLNAGMFETTFLKYLMLFLLVFLGFRDTIGISENMLLISIIIK